MIIIICCFSKNRVIGNHGRLPWHFPADLRHFKAVTSGNTVVFGRKTYENIGPLPNRKIVVLSRRVKTTFQDQHGILWTPDDHTILSLPSGRDIFIAGGEQIYKAYLNIADYMMLTFIHHNFNGDAYFPKFNASDWNVVTARRGNQHSYVELKRK